MKILFLAPDMNLSIHMTGGAGTHMRASVTELRNRGHEVITAIGGDMIKEETVTTSPESSQVGKQSPQ